ncbi:hypothetical protein BTVI_29694 [Pitangus sulphuratus]|nr:hypothetical protein BTVI_29694 [Pitangus sulphuratus]
MSSTQLDKYIMWWVSNRLMGQAQRVTVNGVTSDWQPRTGGFPQGSISGPVLINIFINDLDAGLEGILSKFAGDTKLGGALDSLESWEALQRDLNKLEAWAITNHRKFNKGKCRIQHLGWSNPGCSYRLGDEVLESSAMERDMGILFDSELNMSQSALQPGGPTFSAMHYKKESVQKRATKMVKGLEEPMRTPKTLKIAEIQARHIAVDWESLGYNITRCHTFNVTICYHYFCGHNESKADCLDMDPKAPQHVVDHLPPYTNVSLKMILTNPEGRKESEETIIQTDEDVPGPIPAKSVKGTPFEDKIFLNWKEPVDPNGIITQYEVSYSSIQSFDPAVPVAGPPQTVSKLWNSTHHVFSHLHPGTTYQFFIRASTVKGFGPATTINVTTNISAPTLPDYEGVDASLNETATTITVLLRPAQAKGAPIRVLTLADDLKVILVFLCLTSAYQIVVEELHPHRTKRETGAMECYQIPITYQTALSGGSPYYFAAQLPPGNLPEPAPFTVGDNRTYQGFWNPPLAPRKGYNIYFQAMSSVEKASANTTFLLEGVKDMPETKTQCVRIATKVTWRKGRCLLSKFTNDTKLGGVIDPPEGCAAPQKGLYRLKRWAEKNCLKFNKGKYRVLNLSDLLESSFVSHLVYNKLSMSQQCALVAKEGQWYSGVH